MTIEERLSIIETGHYRLAAQHTALHFAFLALYPAAQFTPDQLEALFLNAHAMAERGLRDADAADQFRRDVSEDLDALFHALLPAARA